MASCDIKFDSPDGIYYAGQSLSAQIELKLTKPKKFRSIYIVVKGRAKCNWIKKYRAHRKTRSVVYDGEENYMETITYLRGNDHSDPVELPPGVHTFNAVCILPTHLPTSFEGSVGHIRYFAKVVIDRPWKFDHSFKRAFTVIRQYDLNFESSLRLPVELHRVHTLCCFPCRSGPFKWTVKLPVGGFAPGQKIPVHVDMVNHSGTSIKHFKFQLRRIVLFHATNPKQKTRREKEEIVNYKLKERGLDYGDTHVEHTLDIPTIPPTNIMNTATCQVTYELKVSAVTSGCHDDIEMKIPIVIGTVPLYPIPLSQAQASPGEAGLQPVINPNYPPPVFEEALNSGLRIIKEPDDSDYTTCFLYTPKYPVYRSEQYATFPNQIHSMYPPATPGGSGQYQGYYQASPTQPPNPPYPTSSGSSSSGVPYPTSPSSPVSESHQHLLPHGGGGTTSPSAPSAPYPIKE